MLNADLLLKNEALTKVKGKKQRVEDDENEAGFHFIAFMPIEDELWKLDGLERQPMCLGLSRCALNVYIYSMADRFDPWRLARPSEARH